MSQIEGKLSNSECNWTFPPTDLRTILSNFVATEVYTLFQLSFRQIRNMKQGGVEDHLNKKQDNLAQEVF